jgi:FKBP-type peptidyl-prolyl cis-trans isomerase FklB
MIKMKQFFLGGVLLTAAVTATAQTPVKKPVVINVLKTYNDSLSYAVGMNVAEGLKQQNVPVVNALLMQKGMESVLLKKTALLTPQQGGAVIQRCMEAVKNKKPLPAAKSPAAAKSMLKTSLDSASYAIGINIAANMKQQQLDNINAALACKALDAVNKKKPTVLTTELSNQIVQTHMQALYQKMQGPANEKINTEKAKGAAFLAENKKRPGVITTASGLQYEVLKRGDSTSARPTTADKFVANYAGTLIDGTEVDNSYKRGQPLKLPVTQVIAGWTEALQLMHIGDKFKIYLHSDIGYGDRGSGRVPGGATLIFEMELLGIEK